jgi:hypothetical protein
LEWVAIAASLIIYFRTRAKLDLMLVYAALMMLATARVLTSTPRYSLLFMPALDIFAALTLVPYLAQLTRRAVYLGLLLFCACFGVAEYRLLARDHIPDPRPSAVLSFIRENRLEDKALLVPQEDLPMIHYYFPRTHLRGYYGAQPVPSDLDQFGQDRILYRSPQ